VDFDGFAPGIGGYITAAFVKQLSTCQLPIK
jgi:hypothetical protein